MRPFVMQHECHLPILWIKYKYGQKLKNWNERKKFRKQFDYTFSRPVFTYFSMWERIPLAIDGNLKTENIHVQSAVVKRTTKILVGSILLIFGERQVFFTHSELSINVLFAFLHEVMTSTMKIEITLCDRPLYTHLYDIFHIIIDKIKLRNPLNF